jgi:hypothetical protein
VTDPHFEAALEDIPLIPAAAFNPFRGHSHSLRWCGNCCCHRPAQRLVAGLVPVRRATQLMHRPTLAGYYCERTSMPRLGAAHGEIAGAPGRSML